jgi:putative nucleotidyltransferase with HDIG domain
VTAVACPLSSSPLDVRRAADLLRDARGRELAGSVAEAVERYEAAIAAAERDGDRAILAEALRRLAVVEHHRNDSARARDLCRRSQEVARALGDDLLTAEALNSAGCLDVATGSLNDARQAFLEALTLGGRSRDLCARVERNLGIVANIHGDLDEAFTRYDRSLDASRSAGDERGCAHAYHNLGMVSVDRDEFDAADRYFAQSREIAERVGDVYLRAQSLVNHAEVHVARGRFEDAARDGEAALAVFNRLGAAADTADAYRVLGVVARETGRASLAESRLRSASDLAIAGGSVLNHAEATHELAVLYQAMGRNQEALKLLNAAHQLFGRLDARRDLVHVDGKVADLEGTYLAVVREWGQSIESTDSYTFGHCERVARNAVAVARALGLDEHEQTTIRLGAYLHDVGKVRVPPAILNKPGRLTGEETELVRQHPVWGIELLAGVEFPWDLKPIIRWHHERYDGLGYPDALRGDAIPVAAQIVGIADVYDALTSTRSYRAALPPAEALAQMAAMGGAWSAPVFEAFVLAQPQLSPEQSCSEGVHDDGRAERAA